MDGTNVLSAVRDAAWLSRTAEAPPPRRTNRFLQRDLSEQGLRLPAERMFTESELAATGQDAFDAGHAAGLAFAATSRAAAAASALATIAGALAQGGADACQIADDAAGALARAMVSAMRTVLPDLIERSALTEIQTMLRHILPGLSREPRVLIEVPDALVEGIEAWLAELSPAQRAMAAVSGQGALGDGEARVSWSAGEARRQPAVVWQAVMGSLEQALGQQATGQQELSQPAPERAPLKDDHHGQ